MGDDFRQLCFPFVDCDDAVVGDVTILANRSKKVEFTQPYAESGLSMIVPAKSEESAWIFMRPFTWKMWVVTGVILIYTMLIVWLLERKQNPDFSGPWQNQISTALWFTFSSLFFAHRERIYSNLTRVVVVVWLFVVLILNSSYTASLSSLLTVQRLEDVMEFRSENILNVRSEYEYPGEFKNNSIAAAFLELPYKKVFITQYCKGYTATTPTYRFGGLGFAFQKGSPIAADFSEAILKLSENGVLRSLEERWFAPSAECLVNITSNEIESLTLSSFWGLYLISGGTSTICFIIFLVQLLRNYRHDRQDASLTSIWRLARYKCNREGMQNPGRVIIIAGTQDANELSSSRLEYPLPSDITDDLQESSESDIEMQNIPGCSRDQNL